MPFAELLETMAQEDRLKRELENLKRQVAEAERNLRASRGDVGATVRELQDLLAYKQQKVLNDDASILGRQLLDQDQELQRQREALKQLDKVMQGLREQRDLLETQLADTQSEVRDSQREAESLRAR
jgi:chromosome segregation ATPase